jgi:hypothetical protein
MSNSVAAEYAFTTPVTNETFEGCPATGASSRNHRNGKSEIFDSHQWMQRFRKDNLAPPAPQAAGLSGKDCFLLRERSGF